MSGYAGVMSRHGSADTVLLERLLTSIRYRGRDRSASVVAGPIALASVGAADEEEQPVRQGGTLLVGDARIDGRDDLVTALRHAGRDVARTADDGQLILHAYAAWGTDCTRRLIGDFSFALWDAEAKRLFCARDHFGIRPFYYAVTDEALIFSNDLSAIASLDELARELNDEAIADFLLVGHNTDRARTTFSRISKLPPATQLTATSGEPRLSRYWSLPVVERPITFDERDAVERFRSAFSVAVKDRARTGSVVLAMSGGLDSTSIAATLVDLRRRGESDCDVRALTSVFDRLIRDEERHYSTVAATALGIDIEHQACDDFEPFGRWYQTRRTSPDLWDESMAAAGADYFARAARNGRVLLAGHGGDALLYATHSHFFDMLRRGRWIRFASEATRYAITRRKRPPFCLRARVRQLTRTAARPAPFPPWIARDFARETKMYDRWRMHFDRPSEGRRHPFRHDAYEQMTSSLWPAMFERIDASQTRAAVTVASPFFDVRLVELALSLPPMPHFADKDILRQSMQGLLPDAIRLRRKTPLAADPAGAWRAQAARRAALLGPGGEVQKYVDSATLTETILSSSSSGVALWQENLALSLAVWLGGRTNYGQHQERCEP